ncbi:uncharacterized protein [Montipora foliosa]|uniref:uncharacterized protein n=1 Tax=Montipora foliosa TaxID=591990 RepID=UPI0035F1825D
MACHSPSSDDHENPAENESSSVQTEEKYSTLRWKSWILCNYEFSQDGLVQAREILTLASKHKENLNHNLNPHMLGRIIREIWGEDVKFVKRGPSKDRHRSFLYLRKKLQVIDTQETFEEFRQSNMELERGWSKISDHSNTVSFFRCESWSFNNQRVSLEVRVTQLPPSSNIRYSLLSHGCENDLSNLMDVTSMERYPLSQRISLILKFIEIGKLCKGSIMENGESTMLSHIVGKYTDLTEVTTDKNVDETRVFSSNCSIVRGDGVCCMNCRKLKRLCTRSKRRRLSRDTRIHPNTNKRYLTKCEIEQLSKERQEQQNAEKRVLQSKEKNKEKTDSVPYKEILKDRSQNKSLSHSRLVTFIHQHQGRGPLSRVYIKSQLAAMCQAYGIKVSPKSSKSVLAEALLNAIPKHNCIPMANLVNDRKFRIVENTNADGRIRIRLLQD